MNIEFIKEKCKKNRIIGKEILFYPEVSSTNDIAKQKAEQEFLNGTVIITDYQTKGRGTRGSSWFASPAEAVLVSVFIKEIVTDTISFSPDFFQNKCAQAMCKTVTKFLPNKKVYIKHPNDIYVKDKKIAGVLVETSSIGNECEYVVLGIGIDVNISEFPEEIKDIATSMKLEIGQEVKREDVVVELLRNLEKNLVFDFF